MRSASSDWGHVCATVAVMLGAWACYLPLAARAEGDAPAALAGLGSGPRRVVEKFLAKRPDGIDSNAADAARVIDLDGDGQPEIVLLWTAYFGNSTASSLSVLAVSRVQQGKRLWREASTVQVKGINGQLDVSAGQPVAITVDSVMLGPTDPRCCPSVKLHRTWSYRGGKLVAQ